MAYGKWLFILSLLFQTTIGNTVQMSFRLEFKEGYTRSWSIYVKIDFDEQDKTIVSNDDFISQYLEPLLKEQRMSISAKTKINALDNELKLEVREHLDQPLGFYDERTILRLRDIVKSICDSAVLKMRNKWLEDRVNVLEPKLKDLENQLRSLENAYGIITKILAPQKNS